MEKTDLKRIIAVSGKPGIYKILSNGRSAVIVESLVDGKRLPVHPTEKISALSDISMFSETDDVPLREIFEKMKAHYEKGKSIDGKSEKAVLRAEVKKFFEDYDAERVHDSDLRKLFTWYNILHERQMLEFENDEEQAEENPEAEQ